MDTVHCEGRMSAYWGDEVKYETCSTSLFHPFLFPFLFSHFYLYTNKLLLLYCQNLGSLRQCTQCAYCSPFSKAEYVSWGSLVNGGRYSTPTRIAIFWFICISLVIRSRSKLKIYFYCMWVGHILAATHGAMQYCLGRGGQLLHLTGRRSTSDKTCDPDCQIFLYNLLLWCENRLLHTFYGTDFSSTCACQVSKEGGRSIITPPVSVLWVHFLWKWILSSSFFLSLRNRSIISGKLGREIKTIQILSDCCDCCDLLPCSSSPTHWSSEVPTSAPSCSFPVLIPSLCHSSSCCPKLKMESGWLEFVVSPAT